MGCGPGRTVMFRRRLARVGSAGAHHCPTHRSSSIIRPVGGGLPVRDPSRRGVDARVCPAQSRHDGGHMAGRL